jgi:hypothetical protein
MIDFRVQILVAVFVLWLLNKTLNTSLEGLGLKKSKEDEKEEEQIKELSSSDYWKPSYYKDLINKYPKKVALSNPNTVTEYAKQFKDTKGIINDNEEKVYGIIRSMKYGTQLSQVSERFYVMYKLDLYNFLQSFLNDSELLKVAELVKNLQTGKLK